MSLSPIRQYHQDLIDPEFHEDPYQAAAIKVLDKIYRKLIKQARQQTGWLRFFYPRKSIHGCYLWGDVGTGKTYLMNTFFQCLPFTEKVRLHFHEFMHCIHTELNALKGEKNPLRLVAKRWAKQNLVLCFDEFFVKDIADAMLLRNVLDYFFAEGICLIATSNVPPKDLYKKGLLRQRFLPAIKILQQHVRVIQVDNHIDYRLQQIKPANVYFIPLDKHAEQQMMHSFHYYVGDDIISTDDLEINHRCLKVIRRASQVVWFSFKMLCETARNSDDYLQIAQQFPIIMLSKIPLIAAAKRDIIVRFINLIDVLYDHHVLLVISAAIEIERLYTGKEWAFEFKRTCSRLQEMQSEQYINDCRWREN